jgi:hypothetical protein
MREIIERWQRAANYGGTDYSDYFVFLSQHRDSDRLTRCNFRAALDAIGGESDSVIIARANHWGYGWVESILIHESDTEALDNAEDILAALSDYPVVDDYALSDMEWDEAHQSWEKMGLRSRARLCIQAGLSIFAARRDFIPPNAAGYGPDPFIYDSLLREF